MHRSQSLVVALSLALGALVSACGGQPVPNNPTYEADVKPILLSRCVRCHGAGGTLNDDPDHLGVGASGPPFDGLFNHLESDCPDGQALFCHGLCFFVNVMKQRFLGYVHATADDARMPPPPTPALSSRQIQVFDTWFNIAGLPGGECDGKN